MSESRSSANRSSCRLKESLDKSLNLFSCVFLFVSRSNVPNRSVGDGSRLHREDSVRAVLWEQVNDLIQTFWELAEQFGLRVAQQFNRGKTTVFTPSYFLFEKTVKLRYISSNQMTKWLILMSKRKITHSEFNMSSRTIHEHTKRQKLKLTHTVNSIYINIVKSKDLYFCL